MPLGEPGPAAALIISRRILRAAVKHDHQGGGAGRRLENARVEVSGIRAEAGEFDQPAILIGTGGRRRAADRAQLGDDFPKLRIAFSWRGRRRRTAGDRKCCTAQ